jgi:hypothetical protein
VNFGESVTNLPAQAGGRLANPDTAKRGLFKQKQLIMVGESAPRVVIILTLFELLLYDPDAQNGALGGS